MVWPVVVPFEGAPSWVVQAVRWSGGVDRATSGLLCALNPSDWKDWRGEQHGIVWEQSPDDWRVQAPCGSTPPSSVLACPSASTPCRGAMGAPGALGGPSGPPCSLGRVVPGLPGWATEPLATDWRGFDHLTQGALEPLAAVKTASVQFVHTTYTRRRCFYLPYCSICTICTVYR